MSDKNKTTAQYPEPFARFYDLIYHSMRDGVDHEYFQNEISLTGGKVLEIGVGTGRLFAEGLNTGADIYGIDISRHMIDVLLGKINKEQHRRVTLQNIIDFSFDFRFDLIIAPFRVIMHLAEKGDQIRALNNVFRHLNNNGRFIFDTFVPDLKQLITGLENHTDFEGEYEPGKKIKRIVTTQPDLINQIILVRFHLEWDEENSVEQYDWEVPLRFFFRYELEHLVERSDFREYKILGDYQGNELNRDSKEFIVVCRK
ncbi:MAG TPA: class I SAM-dependent methyltransferase [Bacteroidales bacterium]|nr:class I SAM-dependent methyltransferase [Bacteroidales bacterium]